MAKDGTNRGGPRPGTGSKRKPLLDKIQDGTAKGTLVMPDDLPGSTDIQGEDVPPVREYLTAKQNPGEENSFRQLRLNQWVKQSVRWMPMDKWDACGFPVSEDDLKGRVCYVGLDLSSTTESQPLCWCSLRWMRRRNTMCCHISGYQRRRWT